ncbi:MAG: amino acid permease [Saprospiraceae bacterium]
MQAAESSDRKFGTLPVFFTAISTILGAVMFLRFGFAVGTVGFLGTIAIILIGHAVTIPTAMAIAEIATNQKVEGGGEYFIVSRSFGLVIGSTIGIALYLSQAISIAFYTLAFTEAFAPLTDWINYSFNLPSGISWLLDQKQTIGIPALFLLTFIMLTKGADLGVKTLYYVVAILGFAMFSFFIGQTEYSQTHNFEFNTTVYNQSNVEKPVPILNLPEPATPDTGTLSTRTPEIRQGYPTQPQRPSIPVIGFFAVFAIIFPAFTGMTAGVGLSGDLKDPGKSIPLGTLSATITGMVIYLFITWKLAVSASPDELADVSKLTMSEIAWQGWLIIPLGLAAATISSALGSIMVAPRTLQAIARDKIFPSTQANRWLSEGKGATDEPYNASIITIAIAGFFILMGALDSVAEIISMFFMVTYGSLCLISFLNHFAADPSYRPRFRSKWFISLFGAIACFGLMFFMNPLYATIAVGMMVGLYFAIGFYNPDKRNIAAIFQGVIFQLSRQLQIFLQKAQKEEVSSWRPSAIALADCTFKRLALFDLIRWLSQKYGFGTYIHYIADYVSKKSGKQAQEVKDRLILMAESSDSKVYVDTLISPSFQDSIAQVIQLPGVAGTDNNLLLLEFSKNYPTHLEDFEESFKLIKAVNYDVAILASSERGYGLKKEIHIWITSDDYANASLMILLGYIILGHSDWRGGQITIFAVYPEDKLEEERAKLYSLIEAGQLPISYSNIKVISRPVDRPLKEVMVEMSQDADLTIVGFRQEIIKHQGVDTLLSLKEIGNTLFVHSGEHKAIK